MTKDGNAFYRHRPSPQTKARPLTIATITTFEPHFDIVEVLSLIRGDSLSHVHGLRPLATTPDFSIVIAPFESHFRFVKNCH